MKPSVFIGATSERKDYAEAIALALTPIAEPRRWYDGVFQISENQQTSLLRSMEECDYVVIVLTGDDTSTSRGRDYFSPRDNLIFEAGISFGLAQLARTFLVPEKIINLKIPSDLNGFTLTDGIDCSKAISPNEAVAKAVKQIKERIESGGKKATLQLSGDKQALAEVAINLIDSAEHHVVMFGGDLSWSEQYADVIARKVRDGVNVEIFSDSKKQDRVTINAKALVAAGAKIYFCKQDPGLKLTLIDHDSENTSRFMISFKDKRLAIGAKLPPSRNDISYKFHVHDAQASPVIWISLVSLYKSLKKSSRQYDHRKSKRLSGKKGTKRN